MPSAQMHEDDKARHKRGVVEQFVPTDGTDVTVTRSTSLRLRTASADRRISLHLSASPQYKNVSPTDRPGWHPVQHFQIRQPHKCRSTMDIWWRPWPPARYRIGSPILGDCLVRSMSRVTHRSYSTSTWSISGRRGVQMPSADKDSNGQSQLDPQWDRRTANT
jgi:hypothetical protein